MEIFGWTPSSRIFDSYRSHLSRTWVFFRLHKRLSVSYISPTHLNPRSLFGHHLKGVKTILIFIRENTPSFSFYFCSTKIPFIGCNRCIVVYFLIFSHLPTFSTKWESEFIELLKKKKIHEGPIRVDKLTNTCL